MTRKWILPVVGGGATLVLGYYIYGKLTAPALPPGVQAYVPPQTEPGIAMKSGRFDIFVPLQGITDVISAVTGGGTKGAAKVEAPVSPQREAIADLPHTAIPGAKGIGARPYTPAGGPSYLRM